MAEKVSQASTYFSRCGSGYHLTPPLVTPDTSVVIFVNSELSVVMKSTSTGFSGVFADCTEYRMQKSNHKVGAH